MSALVVAQDLSVTHAGAQGHTLRNINMSIAPGEIVTVVGPNGSGKSTLIKSLLGHLPPTSGRVERRAGLRIGYVPQKVQIDLQIPLSVRRFLSLPRRVSDAEAREALSRTGVDGLEKRQIISLSGGQFQRVLLARALLHRPELLVLDEPTQGLDQPGIVAFYKLIEDIRRETGAAVLMVSHDLLVVMGASDRVICLNGHICCHGTPQSVSAAPEYHALFGGDGEGTLALYRHEHNHSHDHVSSQCDAAGAAAEAR